MAVWRATFTWKNTFELSFAQNVLHFYDGSNLMNVQEIGDKLRDNFWGAGSGGTLLRSMTANMCKWDQLTLQRIDTTPTGGVFPYQTGGPVGDKVDNVFHEVVGYVFRFYDGGSGPRHRGRMYHFGTPSGSYTRLGPSPGNITAFNVMRLAWLNAFGPLPTTGLNLVLWHRDFTGEARHTNVIDIRLSTTMGIQRRRNPGVGM